MIVADEKNQKVVILDQNGIWLCTINGNLSTSCGLALDSQGNKHSC